MLVPPPSVPLTSLSLPRLPAATRGPPSVSSSCVLVFRDDSSSDTDRGFSDPDLKDSGDRRLPPLSGPASSGPPLLQSDPLGTIRASEPERTVTPPSKELCCGSVQGPNAAPKPKLWSLAEIATSSEKSKGSTDSSPGGGATALHSHRFPHSPALPRHLYYSSPFLHGYSSYGPLGPLSGLQQTVLQRAEAASRDAKVQRVTDT